MSAAETQQHNIKVFKPKPLYTWDIDEYVTDVGTMVVLNIHGVEYARGESERKLALAYRSLVEKIAPSLSRAATIARLMGGEL